MATRKTWAEKGARKKKVGPRGSLKLPGNRRSAKPGRRRREGREEERVKQMDADRTVDVEWWWTPRRGGACQ